jgi:ferredoxin
MQVFKEITNRNRICVLPEIPTGIRYIHAAPAKAQFADKTDCASTCLGCVNPRCMYFSENEVCCDTVAGFPHNKSLSACPMDAMKWNACTDSPAIDATKCIRCGICISRCPVGALYFDSKVNVSLDSSAKQNYYRVDKRSVEAHLKQVEKLEHVGKKGVMIAESDVLLNEIYNRLSDVRNNYHNLIGRNLLIALGCKCSMRRIGDVYTRMDAIYSSRAGTFGAVEIEFGRDMLDASRGVLDDIAVLYTRYRIHKDTNKALVVCLHLPNARQGYWQVVKDVMSVENIKISTVTIGALMLLVWNGKLFYPEDDSYYVDYDNMSIRKAITKQVGRTIDLSNNELGILEPLK